MVLFFLMATVISQMFNSTAELAATMAIPTNKAKAEI